MVTIESPYSVVFKLKDKAFLSAKVLALCLLLLTNGCENDRPVGYYRLGLAKELLSEQTFFPEYGLLLRHDTKGFYIMSTYCSLDMYPLQIKQMGDKEILSCSLSGCAFSLEGKVLGGPAKRDLPYYELVLQPGQLGGPHDTLYARVGVKKSKDWRLPF